MALATAFARAEAAPAVARPAAPVATLGPRQRVTLRWSADANDPSVIGWEVLQGRKVIATVSRRSAVLPAPPPGRRTCYALRALDLAGNRSAVSPSACVEVPDTSPPTAPAGLAARALDRAVELSWRPSRDDVGVIAYELLQDGRAAAEAAASPARLEKLRPGQEVCYAVRARDAAGNRSPITGPVCATPPDTTPPTEPGAFIVKEVSETVAEARWLPSEDDGGVAFYELSRDGKLLSRVGSNAARIAQLRPGVEHCFTVRACDASGNCSEPAGPACVNAADVSPPSRVEKVTPVATGDREVLVRWSAAEDAGGVARYEIQREQGTRARVAGDKLQVLDERLEPGHRYCYVLTAVDFAGHRSPPSEPGCVTTPDLAPPVPPHQAQAAARSATELVLRWDAAKDDVGVAGYQLERNGHPVPASIVNEPDGAGEAIVGELEPDTEYCLMVRARDAAGNISRPSPQACAKTGPGGVPPAPWRVHATRNPRGDVVLAWTPVRRENVIYAAYWDGKKGDSRVGTTARAKFVVFGKAAQERHCYRITAIDANGRESPKSLPVCAGGTEPGSPASAGGVE